MQKLVSSRKFLLTALDTSLSAFHFIFLKGIPYDGEKADVWSMGVVLYTMVTGRMPFDDTDMKMLLEQIKRGVSFNKPKQPISDDCKNLIRNMLDLNFVKRISIEDIKCHRWLAGCSPTLRTSSGQSGRACSPTTAEDDC